MFKSLIASILLSGSIGAKSVTPVTIPFHQVADNPQVETYERVVNAHGVYNLREDCSFTYSSYYNHTFVFEPISTQTGSGPYYKNICPIYLDGVYGQMYLNTLEIDYDDGYTVINLRCYDGQEDVYTYSFVRTYSLSDTTYKSMMFYCLNTYGFNGIDGYMFNNFFTHEDNSYVTSYTGYYYFNNALPSINSKFMIFGSTLFNNNIGFGITNHAFQSSQFGFLQYDFTYSRYDYTLYEFPFNRSFVTNANFNFDNVKIPVSSYSVLQQYGFFGYVRDDSYDHADFKDLLFGVMDSPIYMISRLLSFELFGVNLFVALTGLLTICVILVLIKKFF